MPKHQSADLDDQNEVAGYRDAYRPFGSIPKLDAASLHAHFSRLRVPIPFWHRATIELCERERGSQTQTTKRVITCPRNCDSTEE